MVVQSREVPSMYCFLAAFFNWLFLAGFVIFPGTFTSLSQATLLSESQAGRVVQDAIRNTPLLVVGSLCCLSGGAGIGWLYWKLSHNYVWLIDRVFIPGLLNSVVALLMSLVNIYTAQNGDWSVTAIVTVCIIGICGVMMGLMLAAFELWFLAQLKLQT
ncbi:hypothetical protein EDB81DRAFT_902948 [Dactylonectria macrodidyma]|uniref:Uncharacterized protein n=1 Tax=Dactylonectria macrodidyma TaxID=307937 RepID=A0A9P9E944_9HYPO|nr:hypothetical protein EDB81DRAFT_902948 [Dactylonectria macrodidyma]